MIKGNGFGTSACDNDVQIGTSYHCSIISTTATQIRCQIGNGSLLNGKGSERIHVTRSSQGYMITNSQLKFLLQASISSISPNYGSIMGDTQVMIYGDGFIIEDTRLIIAGTDYTSLANVTYSQITFTTPMQIAYINQNLSVTVVIGANEAICLARSCTFQWSTTITPYFDSVSPNQINGPTVLTIIGRGLTSGGGTVSNTDVIIGGTTCNITSMTNTRLICQVGSILAGNHTVDGIIFGLFSF